MSQTDLPLISLDSRLQLRPLSKQLENGVLIIGHGDQFLELPPEGLDFLAWLDEGLTPAQARLRFEARYNPFPDEEVLDVINAFLGCDFVASIDGQLLEPRLKQPESHAAWLSQRRAQALFAKPVLVAWMAIAIPAVVLWVITPELWPRRSDYFWTEHYFMVVLVGLLLWLFGMAGHELAHWLACRAKGVEATITWTQRLGFFPMSQTIMHNIWAVPRSARLLPIAAGMIWDVLGISLILYLLFFETMGVLTLPLLVTRLLKFYLLTSVMALAAQFWLFSKMDGYFLLSALLGQRNLQADTYNWLRSKFNRSVTFEQRPHGMSVIYSYVVITMVWGGLFMGQFLLVNLPIQLQLLWQSLLKILTGTHLSAIDLADGVAVLTSQLIFWGLLLYAYGRDTLPNWGRT